MPVNAKGYLPAIVTPTLDVTFSNLREPDEYKGKLNHKISVKLTPELDAQLQACAKEAGVTLINALCEREYNDETYTQFSPKSALHIDEGSFPCLNAAAQPTKDIPFGGAKVKLRLVPKFVEAMTRKDVDSISFYLDGVQIIQMSTGGSGAGDQFQNETGSEQFEPASGGTGPAPPTPPATEDDIPF